MKRRRRDLLDKESRGKLRKNPTSYVDDEEWARAYLRSSGSSAYCRWITEVQISRTLLASWIHVWMDESWKTASNDMCLPAFPLKDMCSDTFHQPRKKFLCYETFNSVMMTRWTLQLWGYNGATTLRPRPVLENVSVSSKLRHSHPKTGH
jgi:hypothetical protein